MSIKGKGFRVTTERGAFVGSGGNGLATEKRDRAKRWTPDNNIATTSRSKSRSRNIDDSRKNDPTWQERLAEQERQRAAAKRQLHEVLNSQ